jgi:predicted MFS family arabinose efflux permease
MLAVVPLVSLTDRQPARLIYLASSMLSALSCFGVALCDSLLPALGFRAVAGIALAGMYMPGLQALTDGVQGTMRARIAAWYTSSFTIGASLSFLLARVGTLLGWRSAFVLAGILSTAAVVIAWAALPRADPGFRKEPKSLLDFRPVFANRDALVLIFGYAAVIWGSAGLRQWIVVFLAFCAADQTGAPAQAWTMLAVGALISFLGVPAGLLGNELSIRCAPLLPLSSCCRRWPAACSASQRCCLTSPSYACPWSSASSYRGISPISLRVSSPSPPRGTEEQRLGCIPASALAAGSSEHFSSASRSINSVGHRSSAPGY